MGVSVTENVAVGIALSISVFSSVTVADVPACAVSGPTISVQESVTVQENVTKYLSVSISVSDESSITENIATDLSLNPNINDTVTVLEDITEWIGWSFEQHSYMFFNDDGDEDESTAQEALNTGIELESGQTARIRFLLDAIRNPEGPSFLLEFRYKPNGGEWGEWETVGTS